MFIQVRSIGFQKLTKMIENHVHHHPLFKCQNPKNTQSVDMYPGWLPLLGGQSVPEGSRNPVVCV